MTEPHENPQTIKLWA